MTGTLWYKLGKQSSHLFKESLRRSDVLRFLFMCLQSGHDGVTRRVSGHRCEAVASQLEPGFEYHMIGALVKAIMTAVVVVGLPRGCEQLRKCHSLLPPGGTNLL